LSSDGDSSGFSSPQNGIYNGNLSPKCRERELTKSYYSLHLWERARERGKIP
jgi:hypothetical protein